MPSGVETAKQRRLTATLRFVAAYDGGMASKVKAKRNGRRRVKRRSARLGRIEASAVVRAARETLGSTSSCPDPDR